MKIHSYIYKFVGSGTLVGMASALLLSSCQLGKQYVRPDLEMPRTLMQDGMGNDSATIADYSWQQVYTDTLLQSLIYKMLDYNKDLLMAGATIKEQAALKRIEWANMFPQVGLRVYAKKEGDNYGGDAYDSDNQVDLKGTISWELDLWGKLRWSRDASLADFLGSIENRRALQMSLIARVAQSYFELVALDNELSIVRQTVDARRESLHLARIRYEGGLTSEVAFRQAQVELARTSTLVPDLERQITLKENELAFLTGDYPHEIRRAPLPQEVNFPASLPVGLPSTLLERRPDVREAEQALRAAYAEVGVAYTSMFPSLSLTSQLGAESDEVKNILESPYHLIAGTLLQPIFGFGKNRARLKARKAARERATYAYEKAVLTAFRDAYDAIATFNKMKEIYQTRYSLEQSSKSSLELAQLQYVNGAIGYMDLLDAQRTYLDAQIGLSNALRDRQLAMVNVYKALGGGWSLDMEVTIQRTR